LLDLFLNDGHDLSVIELTSFIDFLLLDGSLKKSKGAEALRGLVSHRLLDCIRKSGFQFTHIDPGLSG